MSNKKHRQVTTAAAVEAGRPPGRNSGLVTLTRQEFQGPLPPPALLEHYERVLPGAADRILRLAEQQSQHRQNIEEVAIKGNVRAQLFGQIAATVIVLAGMGLGAYLIYTGHDGAGFASILTPLGGVVVAFFYGRHKQAEERREKAKELEQSR